MVGMNQYFEFQIKLAGGKSRGGSAMSSSSGQEIDIEDLVPVEKVTQE